VPTLADVLAGQGWRTGAVTEDGMLRADLGFSNGFDFYRENAGVEETGRESRLAEATFGAAIDWVKAHADERFFLFLHTYVVHWPYEPPAEFDLFKTWQHAGKEEPIATAPALEKLRHRYAGEARFGDALFGRLRDALRAAGLADRTLIVVTSDHGEEFGEHGGWSHSRTLYDEVLHVPLIFWAPGTLAPPRRVPGPASLADLMPTVLDVVGVPAPPTLDGRSLLAPPPAGTSERVVYADNVMNDVRQVMARTADAKWLWDVGKRRVVEAFDLKRDPGERRAIGDPLFQARGARLVADYLKLEPAAGPPARRRHPRQRTSPSRRRHPRPGPTPRRSRSCARSATSSEGSRGIASGGRPGHRHRGSSGGVRPTGRAARGARAARGRRPGGDAGIRADGRRAAGPACRRRRPASRGACALARPHGPERGGDRRRRCPLDR
jgi:hypothetical protein